MVRKQEPLCMYIKNYVIKIEICLNKNFIYMFFVYKYLLGLETLNI